MKGGKHIGAVKMRGHPPFLSHRKKTRMNTFDNYVGDNSAHNVHKLVCMGECYSLKAMLVKGQYFILKLKLKLHGINMSLFQISLGCCAFARTPASPTIPMARPAARDERPTVRPAPR